MKSRERVNRRGFLKGAAASAAAGAAAIVGPVPVLGAQDPQQVSRAAAEPQRGTAPSPSAAQLAAETRRKIGDAEATSKSRLTSVGRVGEPNAR